MMHWDSKCFQLLIIPVCFKCTGSKVLFLLFVIDWHFWTYSNSIFAITQVIFNAAFCCWASRIPHNTAARAIWLVLLQVHLSAVFLSALLAYSGTDKSQRWVWYSSLILRVSLANPLLFRDYVIRLHRCKFHRHLIALTQSITWWRAWHDKHHCQLLCHPTKCSNQASCSVNRNNVITYVYSVRGG